MEKNQEPRNLGEWVDHYVDAMNLAWEIWNQYGKNPMIFPADFFGRHYRVDEFSISMGHQPAIYVEDDLNLYHDLFPELSPPWGCPPRDEYVNISPCYICGNWMLVSGGTGCCIVCDKIVNAEEWEKELEKREKTWMMTKIRQGTPYSITRKNGFTEVKTYKMTDDNLRGDG